MTYPNLEPEYRIIVTLTAREIQRKFEFSANLHTYFADGVVLKRPIKGRFRVNNYIKKIWVMQWNISSATLNTDHLNGSLRPIVQWADVNQRQKVDHNYEVYHGKYHTHDWTTAPKY